VIPSDASGSKELKLTIEKVDDTQNLITNKDVLVSPVFEILKNFSENFSKEITLTFAFDPNRTNRSLPSSISTRRRRHGLKSAAK
jgi:trimeric autotransporter adhesin